MFDLDPNKLILFTAAGDGDIDETFPPVEARPFGRFLVAFARCHWTDIKSGSIGSDVLADLVASVDSRPEQTTEGPFDADLWTFGARGIADDLAFAVGVEQHPESRWVIRCGWGVHFAWPNPQSGDIAWGMEVGLLPLVTPQGSA